MPHAKIQAKQTCGLPPPPRNTIAIGGVWMNLGEVTYMQGWGVMGMNMDMDTHVYDGYA